MEYCTIFENVITLEAHLKELMSSSEVKRTKCNKHTLSRKNWGKKHLTTAQNVLLYQIFRKKRTNMTLVWRITTFVNVGWSTRALMMGNKEADLRLFQCLLKSNPKWMAVVRFFSKSSKVSMCCVGKLSPVAQAFTVGKQRLCSPQWV